MKWFKKNIVLVIVVFLIFRVCIWIIRQPKHEGFTETPIVEISKTIYGKTGDDIKSILERYQSTTEMPQAIESIRLVLYDIDLVNKEIDNIKNKCDNSTCDNIQQDDIQKCIPVIEKLLTNVKQVMDNSVCNISVPDKIQLQEHIETIKSYSI
jgi:hypothetical protein